MSWQTILILASICIYFIWFLFLYYTCIKKSDYYGYRKVNITYEKLPIRVWLVIVSIMTVFIPVGNIVLSVFLPLIYLACHLDDNEEAVLRAKDDALCHALKVIGSFLSKPLN